VTDYKPPFFDQLTQLARVKSALLKQPDELHTARSAAAERRRELKAATSELKDVELEVTAMVNGDKAFTNAEARKAEVTRRLRSHAGYQAAQQRAAAADVSVSNAELDVQRLEDQQRAWRAYLDATAAEVALLVAGR
jgi:hypothetical protein